MTVVVFAPHPDDEVLGVGGTLAKYAKAGERTIVIVFSTGTASHPLHKERLITQTRKDETMEAHKELGVTETVFLELVDAKLREEIIEKEVIPSLWERLKHEKLTKLFIPAIDDLHPDHRAVTHAVLQLHVQYALRCPIYTYTNWNPLPIFKRGQPKLVIDTTETNAAKLRAIRAYKSQWVSMYQLVPIVLTRTFFSGLRYGHRWAEVFVQIK